ncbi:MAG: hypothetical protein K1X28_03905 [Parachlamydiales bacterium]|nr:hypothetical protein [Parachlamydiales bacterium]
MSEVSPTGSGGPAYKPQYRVSPEFRKFWEKLFHGAELSDLQIHQMTDQFVKKVSDDMNQVLAWALKEQKKREKRDKGEDDE